MNKKYEVNGIKDANRLRKQIKRQNAIPDIENLSDQI